MTKPRCDTCGETFNSKYHYDLHQQLDACSDTQNKTTDTTPDKDQKSEQKQITTGATGTVCMYDDDRAFGFVTTTDVRRKSTDGTETTKDVFFHISDTETDWIEEGDRLEFTIVSTADGLQAKDIQIRKRDRERESYDAPEDAVGDRAQGFGRDKDDTRRGIGKAGPTNSDIEGFQDERKFR